MFENKKGMSLITMIVTVIIMSLIAGTLVYSAIDSAKIRKLNKFYSDLRQISDAVEVYYLKNGKLPTKDGPDYTYADGVNPADIKFILAKNYDKISGKNSLFNPNDFDTVANNVSYKTIDLELLNNISLNYSKHTFIVNTKSHTIYDKTGITVGGVEHHVLPLNYVDIKNKEESPVNEITLRDKTITNGNNIYYDYSDGSLNIKDLLIFSNESGDKKGQYKKLEFSLPEDENSYFTIDPDSGELTNIEGVDFNSIPDTSIPVKVTAMNYNGLSKEEIFNIYISAIKVKKSNDSADPFLEEINVAVGETTDEFYLFRYGYAKHTEAKKWDINLLKGRDPITKYEGQYKKDTITSKDKITFKGEVPYIGSNEITIESTSDGNPKCKIMLNVFDFGLYKDSIESDNRISNDLEFYGTGDNQKIKALLDVKGPETFSFFDSEHNNPGNIVEWSIVKPGEEDTYVDDNDSGIIQLTTYENEYRYNEVEITPLKVGITYLRYQVKVKGEAIKTVVLPIKVSGMITAEGLSANDTIALIGENKSFVLKYELAESITSGDNTVEYEFSSSNEDFYLGEDVETTNNTGEFTLFYNGDSDAVAEVTITAKVPSGTNVKEYKDTVKVTYTSN